MFKILQQQSRRPAIKLHRYLHASQAKNGYIVLIPEIGEDSQTADGILKPDGLPAFNDITIENCLGAIGQKAAAVEKTVKRIENEITQQASSGAAIDFSRIFRELDEVTGPLDTTWGVAKALYLGNCTLIPTKYYMNIHDRARNARASKFNSKVFYDALAQQEHNEGSLFDTRLKQKYLLEGKLNGLTLSTDVNDALKELLSQLGKERANFKNKVNVATHTFAQAINDFQLVREFPSTLLQAMAKDASQHMQGPWKVSLQPQIVEGFLKYCPDRTQRWNVWQANVRKASGQLDKTMENSTHLEKIRALRKRQANILGYETYADMSMETKMIKNVPNLKQIFAKLLQFAGPAQAVELEQLQQFAVSSGFQHKLEEHDISYWQRKSLLTQHQIDEQALRSYFPLPHVLQALFSLAEKLFNIRIGQRKEAEVWQPAVQYYDVYDLDADVATEPVGGFYVDCYSNENKFGKNSGWMVGIRNRNQAAGLKPLCALIFNFTAPVNNLPYLLSIEDLQLLFKTFGTAMQHLLTRAAYSDLAGLSNIEWDASQVSGNVMSNFLDNPTTLRSISAHYEQGEAIPMSLAQNTRFLKTKLAGYHLCQQLYLADLDIELHKSNNFWLDVVKSIWPVYNILPLNKKYALPCSMTDIFSGDWAAAQFSHLYSKVIAADITDAFEQNPQQITELGKRFKETFLASGGSVASAEVFRRFRGRDPSVEALLRSLNILKTSQTTGDL